MDDRMLNEDQMRERLSAAIKAHGSQMALAKELEIDHTYLSMVVVGRRPLRHRKLLKFLGVKRVTMFSLMDDRK